MITSVPYKPNWLSPVYNPIIWSVNSSKINSQDFKYVFDIYVNGVKVNRIKQRANPTGYGMIDVSNIVEGLLEWESPNTPQTQGETEIDWLNGKVYQDNVGLSKHVVIKVGEEYTTNGVTQIYTGAADIAGEPAYTLYSANTTNTQLPIRAWSCSMEDHPQQWQMQDPTESGIFGLDPFNGDICYDHGMNLAYPLSSDTLNRSMYRFDKQIISWINWSPYPSQQDRPIYGFRWIFKDQNGAVLSQNDVPMVTQFGYAQRTACSSTVTAELDARFDLVHVLASPTDLIEALNAGLFTVDDVYSIEIQGFSKGTNCDFGTPITHKVTLNMLDYCAPLYPRVRLSWFNQWGSRDYMNFTMFMEKTIATQMSTYAQEQMNWSSSTPVPMLGNAGVIKNLGVKGGDKAYNKSATTTYSIQSDWLTQDQIELLEGLQKSPQVLAYIHDELNVISDYYAYTATVSNTSYSVKNVKQVKLVQATFNLTITMSQKMQNV